MWEVDKIVVSPETATLVGLECAKKTLEVEAVLCKGKGNEKGIFRDRF